MNTFPTKHKVSPQLFAAEQSLQEKLKASAITYKNVWAVCIRGISERIISGESIYHTFPDQPSDNTNTIPGSMDVDFLRPRLFSKYSGTVCCLRVGVRSSWTFSKSKKQTNKTVLYFWYTSLRGYAPNTYIC